LARISTYVIDGTIVDGDKVIGSDANNSMVTKNYTVGDLTAYMAQSIGNDFLVPYLNATDDVDLGSFNLSAGSLFLSGSISLDNNEGLEGQVLMSQGIGLPSVWGYNVGSQSLQDVVNIGNISNKSIKLSNVGSQVIDLDINGVYGTAGIKLSDNVNANSSHWDSKSLSLQDVSIGKTATYYSNKITYSNGTNTVSILPANYDNQTFILPVYGGVIPISINGVFADMSGNISIAVGGAQDLQSVTDTGNETTDDIYVTGSGGAGSGIYSQLGLNGLTIIREDLSPAAIYTLYDYASINYGNSVGSYTITPINLNTNLGNHIINIPDGSGVMALSVNGNFADSTGNITISGGSGTVTSVGAGTGMSFTAITTSGNVAIDTAKVPYYASAPANGLLRYTSGTWSTDTNTYLTSAITSLNGLTAASQTFVDDTNVTMVSSGTTHTITWSGTLADSRIASASTWNSKQAGSTNLTSLSGLTYASTSFVKMTASGTFALDTNTYLTSVGSGTTNELTYWSGTNTLGSLTTATYPSLTELAYVKGVTSGIQSQINGKQATLTNPVTGTGTNNEIAYFNTTGSTIASLPTATYPSLTELSYVKGVTSSIQTQIAGKQTDSAWVDCSSQAIVGWSATTVKLMQYKLLGAKTALFMFEIVGTGTGTSASLTLPFTSATWGNQYNMYHAQQVTAAAAVCVIASASTTLTFYPNVTVGSLFTTGQARNLRGQMIINIA